MEESRASKKELKINVNKTKAFYTGNVALT